MHKTHLYTNQQEASEQSITGERGWTAGQRIYYYLDTIWVKRLYHTMTIIMVIWSYRTAKSLNFSKHRNKVFFRKITPIPRIPTDQCLNNNTKSKCAIGFEQEECHCKQQDNTRTQESRLEATRIVLLTKGHIQTVTCGNREDDLYYRKDSLENFKYSDV